MCPPRTQVKEGGLGRGALGHEPHLLSVKWAGQGLEETKQGRWLAEAFPGIGRTVGTSLSLRRRNWALSLAGTLPEELGGQVLVSAGYTVIHTGLKVKSNRVRAPFCSPAWSVI